MTTRPCSLCHKEVAPITVDSMSGEEAGVRMRIEGMPALACAEGHRRFVVADFAVKLMQALFDVEPFVPVAFAVQKGLLRKRYHCAACDGNLDAVTGNGIEVKHVVELKNTPAIEIQVEMPKFHCAACGKDSVLPEKALGEALMKASVHAFRSAAVAAT